MIAITGASGQLGRLVITSLLEKTEASNIIAVVRTPETVQDFADKGVIIRQADYDKPETMDAALEGVEKVLLISSNAVGARFPHHKAVVEAAKKNDVKLLAYTSILHASANKMMLAAEHIETEAYIKKISLPVVMLRNSWYSENYTMSLPTILENQGIIGTAGDGRISSAPRAEYAEAAAITLLTEENQAGKIYELAGDTAYSLADYAAMISATTGNEIAYTDLPEADFANALVGAGLPEGFAKTLADSETQARTGSLFEDGGDLSRLLGRPTTPMIETIKTALSA